MALVASEQDVTAPNERRRVPRRPPGFAVGTLSLAQWHRSRARGRDRGRVTALWDQDRNADTPDDLSYGSSGQVRWFCCEQGDGLVHRAQWWQQDRHHPVGTSYRPGS